ncbi:hypothetical protein J3E69DRAFT_365092 [Trichoderma sp. SZMC 28015]
MPEALHVCASPHLPPIRIELSDLKIDHTHEQYLRAEAAVKAYWRQATNMTENEQKEYRRLLNEKLYELEGKLLTRPSDHNVYRSCRQKPNWARFIFLYAIYEDLSNLDNLDKFLVSERGYTHLGHKDLTSTYRKHRPVPVEGTKRKKVATSSPLKNKFKTIKPTTLP